MSNEPIERASAAPDEGQVVESVSEQDERYQGATPPGYDEWPTHGGYLGCLLGVMISCLLAPLGYIVFGLLGSLFAVPLGKFGVALGVVVTVALYLAVFVGLTRLGWAMGKRFLREYEQPAHPRWGEARDEDYPLVVDADPPSSESGDAALNPDASPAE